MNTNQLILHKQLLSICQYDSELELKQFFDNYPDLKTIFFIQQDAFLLACEEGHLNVVKFFCLLGNELYPRKDGVMPILLKQIFEKGITKATFNSQINVLEYLLFESGLETNISVKGRVEKLLRISQSLNDCQLTEYLFTHPDLIDESLSQGINIKELFNNSIYEQKFSLARLFLTLPKCNKYFKDIQSWRSIVNQYLYQGNMIEFDFFLQLDDFKSYVEMDFIKNALIKALGNSIAENNSIIEYLIFNLKTSEIETFQYIKEIEKKDYSISEQLKIIIKEYFQKIYLNTHLQKNLHDKFNDNEKPLKKIKL